MWEWLLNAGLLTGLGGLIYVVLKTKLEAKITAEHEERAVKFKHLYEQKNVIYQDVIRKLWELEKAVSKFVSLFGNIQSPERAEAGKDFIDRLEEFDDSFQPYRVFFAEALAGKIQDLRDRCAIAGKDFAVAVQQKHAGSEGKSGADTWVEVNTFIQQESPKIRKEIENELRKEFQL